MKWIKEGWSLLKEAGLDWFDDKGAQQGAALAFYSVLSLAPLLVFTLAVAALIFGKEAARGHVADQLRGLMGNEGAVAIEAMIDNAHELEAGSLAALLGVVTLLFGASGVFGQLQESLNIIWEAPPRPNYGWWDLVCDRLLSFVMVLGTGFLLLVSLVLSAVIAGVGKHIGASWPGFESVWQLSSSLASLVMATFLFALIFKVLPDVKIAWRDVWLGALVTAALFTAGKFLIGLYLGKSGLASVYGAGGSLIAVVVWLYYSAQIFLFGAELTQVFAKRCGSRTRASKDSQPITPGTSLAP